MDTNSLEYDEQVAQDIERLQFENQRLTAIIYSIVKHQGENWSLVLEDAAEDELPEKIRIGYNIAGDDAIITVLFGSALERYIIQTEAEDASSQD